MNVEQMLLLLSDEQKAELAKALGIAPKASARKEKVFVANRVQLKDTSATAKRPRKAGEVTPMTERALEATLKTWYTGKKADLIPVVMKSILSGNTENVNAYFKIVGLAPTPSAE